MNLKVLAMLVACCTVTASMVPISARADSSGATTVVRKLYDWYLSLHGNVDPHFAQARAWFDPGLYALLQKAYWRNAHRQLTLDFDPYANAQWEVGSYSLGVPQTSGGMTAVPVTVRLAGQPNGKTHLTVMVKQEGGAYVIYNFVYDSTFNLRDDLVKALK